MPPTPQFPRQFPQSPRGARTVSVAEPGPLDEVRCASCIERVHAGCERTAPNGANCRCVCRTLELERNAERVMRSSNNVGMLRAALADMIGLAKNRRRRYAPKQPRPAGDCPGCGRRVMNNPTGVRAFTARGGAPTR